MPLQFAEVIIFYLFSFELIFEQGNVPFILFFDCFCIPIETIRSVKINFPFAFRFQTCLRNRFRYLMPASAISISLLGILRTHLLYYRLLLQSADSTIKCLILLIKKKTGCMDDQITLDDFFPNVVLIYRKINQSSFHIDENKPHSQFISYSIAIFRISSSNRIRIIINPVLIV